MTRAHLLRGAAVAVALLALLDPALTLRRQVEADVAVVPAPRVHGGATPEVAAVARAVGKRFHLVEGPWSEAAATVLVGEGFPEGADALAAPLFRVVPDGAPGRTRLVALELPARVPVQGTVPVGVVLSRGASSEGEAEGPGAAPPELALLRGGVELDRVEARPLPGASGALGAPGDPGLLAAELGFVPPGAGVHTLQVVLHEPDRAPRTLALGVVEASEARWHVLFLDARPSWPSTFVRRALEGDARFEVAGRVETAPGLATTFGAPPEDPGAPGALDPFDLVVVGAPEAVTGARVQALEGWVRAGGTLVLLLDAAAEAGRGPGYWESLAGTESWDVDRSDEPLPLALEGLPELEGAALPPLLARVRAFPRELPPGARVWGTDPGGTQPGGTQSGGSPHLWTRPLGEGTVVVSGALDAWEHRGEDRSGFTPAWRAIAARAAALAPPALELRLEPGGHPAAVLPAQRPRTGGGLAVLPGAPVRLALGTRIGAEGARESETGAAVRARASLEHPAGSGRPLSLWPAPTVGALEAAFRAPETPGVAWVRTEVDGDTARVPLVVDPQAASADPGADLALLGAWSRANGGEMFEAGETDALLDALEGALGLERRREAWHPMRSPWWILPFALALGGEWWLRRRRGLP
jgi:hypothetical protein